MLDYIATRSSLHLRFAVANRTEMVPNLRKLLFDVVRWLTAVPLTNKKFGGLGPFQRSQVAKRTGEPLNFNSILTRIINKTVFKMMTICRPHNVTLFNNCCSNMNSITRIEIIIDHHLSRY